MKKIILLTVYLLFSVCIQTQAQTDYKSNGFGYVAKSDYANAKIQFEAARAALQSKNVDKNSEEYISIEKLIAHAEESEANRNTANKYLAVIQEEKLAAAFAQCSSEDEAEAKKKSLKSSATNAKNALSKIISRFPTDRVAQAQLAECSNAEDKINSLIEGFPEVLAWRSASTENTLTAYESFLKQYPNGNYAQSAKTEIFNIRETEAWTSATNLNTYNGYKDYIANFPNGQHIEEAQNMAYNIGMNDDWNATQKANTTSAYMSFISKYPDSKYIESAQANLAECQEYDYWEKLVAINTIEAYNSYLSKYPNGKYTAQATNNINKITESQVWEDVVNSGTIAAYEQYLSSSKLLAYKDEAQSRIAEIKHAEEVAADNKRWERIAKSKNPDDFKSYINSIGYKGHLTEAKGLESLMLARNASLTSANAAAIADNYSTAAQYINLGASDIERMNKAGEMAAYAKYNSSPSTLLADYYLSHYPNGAHAMQVSENTARLVANSMTYDYRDIYRDQALSYAKTSSTIQYVNAKYKHVIRAYKREPIHWSAGLQVSYNYGLNLQSAVYRLNNSDFEWDMNAKEVIKPELDYGVLAGLGGHSNRFNLELGYNIASSSILARPKINIIKKNYKGATFTKPRSGNSYSLGYFYIAPEARYYFKPMQYIMAPVESDQERAELYGYTNTVRYGQKLDYGVNIGFGIYCFDVYVGYFIPNKIITAGFAIYFSNK